MGQKYSHIPAYAMDQKTTPTWEAELTFDPHFGFEGKRKERERKTRNVISQND